MRKFTEKNGRYPGLGDPLIDLIIGRHWLGAQWLPANHASALIGCGFYHVVNGSYVAADWTETKENSGTIAMSAGGVLFTTGDSDGNSCNIQLIRSVAPSTDGVIHVYGQITMADVENTGVVFGLHDTDADYFSTELTHQAVFLKAKGAATFVGRTKDGTTGSSTSTLLTAEDDTVYDFCVTYIGATVDGSGARVVFGVKAASAVWTADDFTTKTTNLPATNPLRLCVNIENNEGAANTMTLVKSAVAEVLNAA